MRQAHGTPRKHPKDIPCDSSLSEVVEFEIPSFEDATRLCRLLALNWFTWVHSYEGLRFVVVLLAPDGHDLAALLRAAQEWSRQQGRDAIPFELDGRRYVLEAKAPPTGLAA